MRPKVQTQSLNHYGSVFGTGDSGPGGEPAFRVYVTDAEGYQRDGAPAEVQAAAEALHAIGTTPEYGETQEGGYRGIPLTTRYWRYTDADGETSLEGAAVDAYLVIKGWLAP